MNSMPYNKPVPVPDADTEPFWSACREGRLSVQCCSGCGAKRLPPERFCPKCHAAESEWRDVSGRGKVYSWIVVRHPVPGDVYAGDVPYVVALIDLAEGVLMASNIIDCDPDAVTAEMAVEVVFEAVTDDITLPKFRPS